VSIALLKHLKPETFLMSLTFDPILKLPWLLGLWSAGLLLSLWWYTRGDISDKLRRRRPWLMATRVLTWLALLFVALRPTHSEVALTEEKSQVVFVRDLSSSMNTLDMPGGMTRQAAVYNRLEELAPVIQELEKRADIEWFVFARNLESRDQESQLNRDATAIGEILAEFAIRPRTSPIDSIIVISDGINNSGRAPVDGAFKLAQQGLTVHGVAVGQTAFTGDFADGILSDLKCPPAVEHGKEMKLYVEGLLRGLADRDCTLDVLIDGKRVQQTKYRASSPEEQLYQMLQVPIDMGPGFHRLTVALQPLPEEVSPHNNQVSTFFKVKKDGIQVLYLESVIRPEYKFIKRVLERNQDLSLIAKSPFWLKTEQGRAFRRELDVHAYDVILIGDVQQDLLSHDTWDGLKNAVRNRGAGLALLGGSLSLQPEFLREVPISGCLPIVPRLGTAVVEQFSPRLVAENRGHFVVAGLSDKPVPWHELKMQGLRNSQLESSGTTLLADEHDRPLLVVGRERQGRVAVVATDCTWNWLTDDAAPKDMHPRLWTRLIYWLASREDGMTAQLSIATGDLRYKLGEEIMINGDLMDAGGATVTNANVALLATSLDGDGEAVEVPMIYEADRYVGLLNLPKAGAYSLRAHTTLADAEVTSNELRIVVYETRLEDQVIVANHDTMGALAARTGGQFVTLDELDKVLRDVSRQVKVVKVERVVSAIPLWDNWWVLAAIIAMLALDWAFRRRSGLP
jgi:uncharacterized membrane protein